MSILENFISKNIKTYKYDEALNHFEVRRKNTSDREVIKDIVSIINFLEENNILYTVEPSLCIRLYAEKKEHIVVELDSLANIISFNDYASSLTGYQSVEVLQKSWIDIFIPHDEKEKISYVHQSVLERGSVSWYWTNDIICKDKSRRTVKWNNFLLKPDEKTQEKVFSIGQVVKKVAS